MTGILGGGTTQGIMLHQVSNTKVHPGTSLPAVYGVQPSSETVGTTIGLSLDLTKKVYTIHPCFGGAQRIFFGHLQLICVYIYIYTNIRMYMYIHLQTTDTDAL